MTSELYTRDGTLYTGQVRTDAKGKPFFMRPRPCSRCGGIGGSDKWGPAGSNTGWTCFDCGGSGKHKNGPQAVSLYTRDYLDKLNVRKAKADAKRAAKAEAARIAEAARRDAERSAVIASHADDLKRIRKLGKDGGEGFVADMYRQVVDRARPWSEKQIAAVHKTLDRMEAEAARIAAAQYVGEIGERREFTLTPFRAVMLSNHPVYGEVWLTIARDQDGNTITYKGRWNGLGFATEWDKEERCSRLVSNSSVKIKATVKEHYEYHGEPQTQINRPKAII